MLSVACPGAERMDIVLHMSATAQPKPGAMPQRMDVLTTLTSGDVGVISPPWGDVGEMPKATQPSREGFSPTLVWCG